MLLGAILPPGENRFKHVREWNLPWSLQRAALREGNAAPEPGDDCPPGRRGRSSWSSSRSSARDARAVFASGGTPRGRRERGGAVREADPPLDAWAALWLSQGMANAVPPAVIERALGGRYWRERLRKRGHCFFLLLEHWTRHAPAAMGTQPDESTNWRVVPGHAVLIKAFLLEMRQRPVHLWPESMRSCLAALVQES